MGAGAGDGAGSSARVRVPLSLYLPVSACVFGSFVSFMVTFFNFFFFSFSEITHTVRGFKSPLNSSDSHLTFLLVNS